MWRRKVVASIPDESTQERRALLIGEAEKLRRARALAARMQAHDQINTYARRLRAAYAATLAEEGKQ